MRAERMKKGVGLLMSPKYTYAWKEDGVIKMYEPEAEAVVYVETDDGIICQQRKRKAVVFKIVKNGAYPYARVDECLDLWR